MTREGPDRRVCRSGPFSCRTGFQKRFGRRVGLSRRVEPAHGAVRLLRHRWGSITSSRDTRKSTSAGVDISQWRRYGFLRSREGQQGLAETNCRQAVVAVRRTVRRWSSEARVVAGRRRDWRPDRAARSDQGTPHRNRGHGRCGTGECSARYTAVKSSSSAPGEGVGCGRAHREVRAALAQAAGQFASPAVHSKSSSAVSSTPK